MASRTSISGALFKCVHKKSKPLKRITVSAPLKLEYLQLYFGHPEYYCQTFHVLPDHNDVNRCIQESVTTGCE
jgi:hypothetical protein